jgi:hypothetical protein
LARFISQKFFKKAKIGREKIRGRPSLYAHLRLQAIAWSADHLPPPSAPNLNYRSHIFPTPIPITSLSKSQLSKPPLPHAIPHHLSLSLFVGRISDPQCISLPTEVHHHPVLEYIPRTTRSPPRHCRSMASMPPLLEGLPTCHPESIHCPVPEKRLHSRRRRCCPDAHY